MAGNSQAFNFDALLESIQQAHRHLAAQAGKAVNVSVTIRNWIIGCYIYEYEQKGADRADYGEALLDTLSVRLKERGVTSIAARSLRLYRQFYMTYPHFWQTLSAKSSFGMLTDSIWQSLTAKSQDGFISTIHVPNAGIGNFTYSSPNTAWNFRR